MPARGQIKPHEAITRLQQCQEHRLIGLRAGMRLHIGKSAIKQLAGAFNGEPFGNIHRLAAAIIAPARITLGVFIRHHRPLRFHHSAGDDVFGGDQFNPILFAFQFLRHGGSNFGIGCG